MDGWFDVCPVDSFHPGEYRLVAMDTTMAVVSNIAGEYHAVDEICTHEAFPIVSCGLEVERVIENGQLICPRHGARFCMHSGAALTPPAFTPLYKLPVRVYCGMVQVKDDRDDSANSVS